MATDERDTEHSVPSEGLDKKKTCKFQTFKKLFGKRKKRETAGDQEDSKLKPSSSFGNVCDGSVSSDEEANNGLRSSNYNMGTRAFSHDSIFIPDGRTGSEESLQAMSQDNILGKVKTLQQQLAKNIKFGQPPQVTVSAKTIGEASASLEADVLLNNQMETETQQDTVLPESHNQLGDLPGSLSPASLHRTRHEGEEKVTPVKPSSRPKRHHSPSGTIETVNLDAIPLAIARLDNSAAKHKLSVKPKNQRVSKKHRTLSKELESITVAEFQPEVPELSHVEDKVSKHDGHHIVDKPIHLREDQEQKAEGKGNQENHWVSFETENKVPMMEVKVKIHMEPRGLQEFEKDQREQEETKQKFQDEQFFKMEDRKEPEGKKTHEGQKHQECLVWRQKAEEESGGKEEELQELGEYPQPEEKHQGLQEQKQSHQELEVQRQEGEYKQHEPETGQQWKEEKLCELEAERQWEEESQHGWKAQKQKKGKEQCELRAQRQLTKQKQSELEAQKVWKEQKQYELETQRQQEQHKQYAQEAQKLEEQRQCEVEAQRHSEEQRKHELEAQRQQQQQRQCELKAQKLQENQRKDVMGSQRQWEEQNQHKLEAQGEEKGQKQCELEAQKLQGEPSQCALGTERLQDERRHGEQEEQKQQAKKSHQDIEDKKPHEKLLLQGWRDKREELEKQKQQEETQGKQGLEEKRGEKLEGETHKAERQDELNQQVLQLQKTGQRQKELEKPRALEGKEKLQKKDSAIHLGKQKRPKEQEEYLEARQLSCAEKKQQESKKQIHSPEYGKGEPAKLKQLWDEKGKQQKEWRQREGEKKLDEEKTLGLEGPQTQGKPKEEDESFPMQLDKNENSEEKQTEIVKKELPLKEQVSQQKIEQADKGQREGGTLRSSQNRNPEVQEQERIHGEELRWQEVDARQTMPRGFTFQVSSGEKQIIFQKVNLSPVTPVKEPPVSSNARGLKTLKSDKSSPDLPRSLCVPHTAILVTGAQLCGTDVNLNQIKDTACKSLLCFREERKTGDVSPSEHTQKLSPEPKPSSGKMKHAQDPSGNQAMLAEWACIRSKILKSAENGQLHEKDKGSLSRHSDDWTPKGRTAPHVNLRKTLSANAKFSITPAWQKFSEVSKGGAESKATAAAENTARELSPPSVHANREAVHPEAVSGVTNVLGSPVGKSRVHHEVADNTEGCKFAKDLPSFLVPSATHALSKEMLPSETSAVQQNLSARKLDKASPSGEENLSPFGVKLRRTNYSLRFHYDQQAEQKKKKRYSAGDSFDGIPTPLVTPDSEQDTTNLFLKVNKSPHQERKEAVTSSIKASLVNVSQSPVTGGSVLMGSRGSAPSQEKPVCKSPLPQKPALAPKPISQTPPTSPLLKMRRLPLAESSGQRLGKTDSDTGLRKREAKGSPLLSQAPEEIKNEEEEFREKKSFFPSITMPWREKAEKKPEPPKRDRPVLQSRHSIDGSKLVEKIESSQPLWITLALQKQKGFREQQATREERRQAREAKQAEKLAKENASINQQSDNKNTNGSRTSALRKNPTQEEVKKVETAMSRLERREQLKKSNTLPTSVTVEISDSLPPSPLGKEVTKRFSNPDANPVSTEPAWLALAKRKAKAWSDCPQIIK